MSDKSPDTSHKTDESKNTDSTIVAGPDKNSNVPEIPTTGTPNTPGDSQHTNPSNIPADGSGAPEQAPFADVPNHAYKPSEAKNLKALAYKGEPKLAEIDFVYTTHLDPARQADPRGVYLDDVQRQQAEIQRAKVEGREPDLENPPATTGTMVVPTHVARTMVAGDVDVPVSFSQDVMVGTNETNLSQDIEAARAYRRQQDEKRKAENSKAGNE